MARGKTKKSAHELAAQSDPKAPLDAAALLSAIKPVHKKLVEDLVARADNSPGVTRALKEQWQHEQAAKRTADTYEVWRRSFAGQVASAWVLSVVFVRTLEDRGLLDRNRIAGAGAEDSQKLFLQLAPFLNERDYLLTVFRELAHLPAARDLFDVKHNLVWRLAPSAEGAQALLALFRQPNVDQPAFRFGQNDSRFLGDLYQDLDEDVRKRYALLQTPSFIESFILDQTLESAIKEFGLDKTTLIDPTCGSGHFLLGAFERLLNHRLAAEPGRDKRHAALAALGAIYGVDINPYAVAIARFRLTLVFLEKAGFSKLASAPAVHTNLVVADSLLHGRSRMGQTEIGDLDQARATDWRGEAFSLEDENGAKAVLSRRYAVVVGNPPYITEKDPAKRELYRGIYRSAAGLFSLAAPFTERFFGLGDEKLGGFVGMINANSFMRREFGKGLIEQFLPSVDLTKIIDTSGAFIPGHGTPTVLLFGRARRAVTRDVPTVMGKRGEPASPQDPANGVVWSSIRDHHEDIGFDNEYVSVAAVPRTTFNSHPWSLNGGGALALKELLDGREYKCLKDVVDEIGFICITRADDIYFAPREVLRRRGIRADYIIANVEGDKIRDWSINNPTFAVFPYTEALEPVPDSVAPEVHRFLWPYREILWRRREPNGDHRELGRTWWEWSRFQRERFRKPLSIAFSFIATHNHFALDRGGKVFNRSAPIIKLKDGATEDEHLALVGYLNSSTVCFWLKQVLQPKGATAENRNHPDQERFVYEFAVTALGQLPTPPLDRLLKDVGPLAKELDRLASERECLVWRFLDEVDCSDASMLQREISHRWTRLDHIRNRMIFLQEEIDWRVYDIVGLAESLTFPLAASDSAVDLPRGMRSFERVKGRRSFVRVGGEPLNPDQAEIDVPGHVSDVLANLIERRASRITGDSRLSLCEQYLHKRLWRDVEDNTPEQVWRRSHDNECLRVRLLTILETCASVRTEPFSVSNLASEVVAHRESAALMERSLGSTDPREIHALCRETAVPYLPAFIYTDSGLEKRQVWQAVWAAQRKEDAGERPPPLACPPEYSNGSRGKSRDFLDDRIWRLRGPLDVSHERLISYPGCESDEDKQPVYGWAGWNRLEQAQALAALYQKRKADEGWSKERLIPMLAGLRELVPWVKQWHNEPNKDFDGLRLGDYFDDFVKAQCRELGLKEGDLINWRPATGAGKRGKKAKVANSAEPDERHGGK